MFIILQNEKSCGARLKLKKLKTACLAIIVPLAFMLLFINSMFAAPKQASASEVSPEEESAQDGIFTNFTEKYKLQIGILPGFSMPLGDVSDVLGSGFGGKIFINSLMPMILNRE